jgi:predicted membrane channel-forming protein YqfA (hemolysin III family)
MKKTFFTASFVWLIAINCFSQSAEKKDYLQKSKNQKTVFFVLAGTGSALMIGGLIYAGSHNNPEKENYNYNGGFIFLGGLVFLGSSIPFLIGSVKNKKKAISLSFKNERSLQLNKNNFVCTPVPSLTLKVRL